MTHSILPPTGGAQATSVVVVVVVAVPATSATSRLMAKVARDNAE